MLDSASRAAGQEAICKRSVLFTLTKHQLYPSSLGLGSI